MASATQIAALNVVHKHCEASEMAQLKQKLNDVMLEMERKSMAAEDARSTMMSPHSNFGPTHPEYRFRTWKEYGQTCGRHCIHLRGVINEARNDLLSVRQQALAVLHNDGSTLTEDSQTTIKDVLNTSNDADEFAAIRSSFVSGTPRMPDESDSSDEVCDEV